MMPLNRRDLETTPLTDLASVVIERMFIISVIFTTGATDDKEDISANKQRNCPYPALFSPYELINRVVPNFPFTITTYQSLQL